MLKLILVSLLFISCSASNSNSVELIFGLKSYMSMKKVQNIIEQKNGTWDMIEDIKTSDKRPKYRFSKIKTTIFKYKGLNGITFLEFFNDHLMSVIFYPTSRKKVFLADEVEFDNPNVTINKDIKNKLYIKWSDHRLEKNFQNWLSEYS